jgi:integrative and conjugative element protein (TIGR02256 family)
VTGGDILSAVDVLERAEAYFLGYYTKHWPPDTIESELESHFHRLSDVLIADSFYEGVPDGHGRFFCIPDLGRLRDVERRNWCPMIVTAMTAESPIIRNFDARKELSRLYPWIEDSKWNAYDQMIAESSSENASSQRLTPGYWWSLPEEPLPFHDGKGFLQAFSSATGRGPDEVWQTVSETVGSDMTTSESHLIGLRYPARRGGLEWLVLFIAREPQRIAGGAVLRDDASKRIAFEHSYVSIFKVHRLKRSTLTQRNTEVVNAMVQSRAVALPGLGAIGSRVAEMLAQAGVARFRVCDNDFLRIGNTARHIAGVNDFGAPKVNAVVTRLLNINPYIEFHTDDVLQDSAVSSLDKLAKFIEASDLTICTIADENVESVVNQIALVKGKTVLYGRSLRKGSMGRVFLVRPGYDACKACLAHYGADGRRGNSTPPDWIDIPEEDDEVLYHECARPVLAGSAVDLSFTASLVARVALNFLEGRAMNHNHWIWSQSASVGVDPRLDREMATVSGSIARYDQCPVCGEPQVREVILSEEVREAILTEARTSPSAETGGILIGYIDDERRGIVLRATGPGTNAIRSEVEFHRDVDYVQNELDKAGCEFGDRGLYIGEWHSHPGSKAYPSPRDIQSLFEISRAPNYLTVCPVMIIAGVDDANRAEATLKAWAFPISGRMYSVDINAVSEQEARD